jgi:diaminohydroxyphosphoribosylaminopyrimidine deaminase/5-amino-6-(5-phosphoribosylamino)uracil reductase
MSLDGKIATTRGDSKWISNERSRAIVHQLRGRMDAVVVGRGTVEADDPLLTARPSGPRVATRVVLDSKASISLESQLVRSGKETPVLIATASDVPAEKAALLKSTGCELFQHQSVDKHDQLGELLSHLAGQRMTNILVEGGATVLGTFFDLGAVDEVHVFIAPKIVGGELSPTAVKGVGVERIMDALQLEDSCLEQLGGDVYIHGRVARGSAAIRSAK